MPTDSLVPPEYILEIVQGDDVARLMTFTDEAGDEIDLTGYAWAGQVLPGCGGTAINLAFDTADAADGQITFRLTRAQTAGLSVGKHRLFVHWTDLSDERRTVLAGSVKVAAR